MRKKYSLPHLFGCLLATQMLAVSATDAQNSYSYVRSNTDAYKRSHGLTIQDTNVEKAKLFTVLKELNKQKGVYFLFSEQSLGNQMVNPLGDTKEATEKILDEVLSNTGIRYKKLNDKTYVILSDKDKKRTSLNYVPLDGMELAIQASNLEVVMADPITGKITGPDGSPIANATVSIKGTSKGTTTNSNGIFTLAAKKGDVLIISYVGYTPQQITVGDESNISVSLLVASQQMNEVVVTALGIQKKSRDLTYATQKLNNSDLTTVKDANFVNSLSGKVAGVTITKSSSGTGGSARVLLRGNKSTQNNQPLYVIDGIPLPNFSPSQPTDVWGQGSTSSGSSFSSAPGRDGGDGISNLNPDDIESVTVLKGASGAALYGSQAANGAIVITTKTGKAGKARINLSSDVTFDKPMYYPESQFKYGQGLNGKAATDTTTEDSWGKVVNAPDHVKSFYQTGVTTSNSISLSGGTERAQTYFSYGNTYSKGVVPTSTFNRNNINVRETMKFLDDRLSLDANFTFLNQKATNRPVSGIYANPLTGLYLFPRGLNFDYYRNNYQYFSQARNMWLQNWYDINYDKGMTGQDHEQNPFWLLNKAPRVDQRDRVIGNITLKYKLLDWLNIQARGNFDKSYDTYDSRMYAGTQSVQAPPNGRYTLDKANNTQLYGDVILMANKQLNSNLNLQANLGSSITDTKLGDINFDTDPYATQGLYYPNKFGVNYIMGDAMISGQTDQHKQQQSVFGSVQLGYKGFLFVDLTGRNDWSSTFAFTPTEKKGYFYYSAGANLILSEAVHLPDAISFAKVRASYAKVGNDVSIYATNPAIYKQDNRAGAQYNTKVPFPGKYLKPEDNRSFEIGTEWRFIHDRVGFDVTYYKNNNYQQYMEVPAGTGTTYSLFYLNMGNIQNTGVEATVFVQPIKKEGFNWTSTFNYATNVNKVINFSDPNVPGATKDNAFALNSQGVNMYQAKIQEGGSWGDIYGNFFQRDASGAVLVNVATDPGTGAKSYSFTPDSTSFKKPLGNPNPKYTLGWNNNFDIKNFNISFLIEGRFGGEVLSVTQAMMDQYGDSKASADARDAGKVNFNAVNSITKEKVDIPVQDFYKAVGGRAGITEYYMYDATAVRLRELAIGYNVPLHSKGINNLRVSLIGRNLFFFSKKAPFDPETSMGTGNAMQGIETFGIPSTRSLGFSLKLGF
ncbi:SusC/RagA family TonB-linked outer membrane protein [Pinibacter soli]|uniref:SusC/RagA family TonB-linked outer membrane protein n=1 Tax=Pinibacter soli TaxID=3044211 RepID=A0ABT6RB08_9BACT|nr:SusC/RagA family TonB-linked outer membrane protein [Pinibacter soli]MDI3319735.1 SusC/RagA family TonB-linked outer membrane protein [Pinibacter soli]